MGWNSQAAVDNPSAFPLFNLTWLVQTKSEHRQNSVWTLLLVLSAWICSGLLQDGSGWLFKIQLLKVLCLFFPPNGNHYFSLWWALVHNVWQSLRPMKFLTFKSPPFKRMDSVNSVNWSSKRGVPTCLISFKRQWPWDHFVLLFFLANIWAGLCLFKGLCKSNLKFYCVFKSLPCLFRSNMAWLVLLGNYLHVKCPFPRWF